MAQVQPVPAAPSQPAEECIRIRGARVHNLQNVDVDIPRGRLVVLSGLSGSGKSSLAFDTIFAEGQRQYIESLSVYARQFLNQVERPDVDLIEGLEPTISIDQRGGSTNPRSTVATVSGIYDYLRLLMARLGDIFCYRCGAPIRQQSPEQILEDLLALGEGTRAILFAPWVRGRKGKHEETLIAIRKAGFLRARVDGELIEVEDFPELAPHQAHDIDAVVDRVVVREKSRARLAESLQLALKHGQGLVLVSYQKPHEPRDGPWHDRLHSTLYACPTCKISYEALEPRNFSFNSPYGACPACEGLGRREQFDPELVLADKSRSLAAGAVAPWGKWTAAEAKRRQRQLQPFFARHKVAWTTPLCEYSPRALRDLLEGHGKFPGLLTLLEQDLATATDERQRERLEGFRGVVPCGECGGARLRPEARSVRVGGKAIHEITALTIAAAAEFFDSLPFEPPRQAVAQRLVQEIGSRLRFLQQVGVGYLSLDRPSDTLSGGESQRVRLATSIGSGLVGVCYVLDEPTVGLHHRDTQRLVHSLRELQQQGNTVLVVEHDEAVMRCADWLIDLGPGAGHQGGRIVAQGTPQQVAGHAESLTGQYLAGKLRIDVPPRRRPTRRKKITLVGAQTHTLKNITVSFPLSALVCVTGVSGSGKSSLLHETLAPALRQKLHGSGPRPGPFEALRGADTIDKLVIVDQSPLGRTPRSNPATYTGAFDEIRRVFAGTRLAKLRGYKASRFSFNVKGGRCEACSGQGFQKIEMNFLPDLLVTCPVCQGKQFNRQTLEVTFRGHSIADVLAAQVDDAVALFENIPPLHRILQALQEVGLGYLALGQPATTLSGGEAQRIKLAAELGRAATGQTLYILDEPTAGLHFADVQRLLAVLQRLVDGGNTVIVIEHHLDVIKSADWVIDLGPEGGDAGGYLLAAGPPELVAAAPHSATGACLREVLGQQVP